MQHHRSSLLEPFELDCTVLTFSINVHRTMVVNEPFKKVQSFMPCAQAYVYYYLALRAIFHLSQSRKKIVLEFIFLLQICIAHYICLTKAQRVYLVCGHTSIFYNSFLYIPKGVPIPPFDFVLCILYRAPECNLFLD